MIYLLDDGYSGTSDRVTGDRAEGNSHGTVMADTILIFNPRAEIHSVTTPHEPMQMMSTIAKLMTIAGPDDIVVFGWICDYNHPLNLMISRLGNRTNVICPAGNYGKPAADYTPSCLKNITVVSAINHENRLLSKSNTGDHTVPMYGIPMHHLGITERGTSVATAIYAGLFSRNKSDKFMRRATKVLYNMFRK